MSTDLITQLQQNSLMAPGGLNADTLAVAGRANNRRLSVEGGKFNLVVNGNEIASTDKEIEVIFVKMAHTPSRTFYGSAYTPGAKSKPLCWSNNAQTPDADVKTPQAPACNQCAHSIRGATPACKLSWRTAVVQPGKPNDVMQLILSPKSCFGEEVNGKRPFQTYIRFLAANGINNNNVITKISFDKSVTYQKLLFEPSGAVPMDMLELLNNVSSSDEAKNYVILRVYQEAEEETPVAQPTLTTPSAPPVTPAAPVTDVAEPTLRASEPVAQPAPPKADVSSIINKWSAKS